jgi:hypothetical protein
VRHTFLLLLLLGLFCPSTSNAKNAALENVRRAQATLGSEIWSRIIEIHPENPRRGARREVYALVFEFSGILWFYSAEGTQSFSLQVGDLENQKHNFAPLLRAINPAYSRFEVVEAASQPVTPASGSIANGCFIESIVALRDRLDAGEEIESARLLSYYQDMYGTIVGHTVLTYQTPEGAFVIDPQLGRKPMRVARTLSDDAGTVARRLFLSYLLVQARWIDVPMVNASRIARANSARVVQSETERILR